MSGFLPQMNVSLISDSGPKKRKRDSCQLATPNPSNDLAATIISSTQTLNSQLLLNYASVYPDNDTFVPCLQRLPRKRRVLPQPYPHSQQPNLQTSLSRQVHINASHNNLLSPTICVSASSGITSPPVSPKTIMPAYAHQQDPCTSTSIFRSCHICHRRPTTREILDAYADCDLCYQRTCHICLRQCDSSHYSDGELWGDEPSWANTYNRAQECINRRQLQVIQPRKVCSCCAVEGVTETGIDVVRCLDCVHENLPKWPLRGDRHLHYTKLV